MKKAMLLIMIGLICSSVVFASKQTTDTNANIVVEEIVQASDILDSGKISRGECLTMILKSTGLKSTYIEELNGNWTVFVDVDLYSYYSCARRADIAYGEACIIDYETIFTSHTGNNYDYFFFPERAVTLEECLAFMVRCLEEEQDEEGYVKRIGLEEAVIKAKQYGIIAEDDCFASDVKGTINLQTFKILLERFMQQKRYKYFGIADFHPYTGWFLMSGLRDETGSMTYLEMWENER